MVLRHKALMPPRSFESLLEKDLDGSGFSYREWGHCLFTGRFLAITVSLPITQLASLLA